MSTETAPAQTPPAPWVPSLDSFGARLALIRQRMGWGNIAKAAKECGVPTDSWRNWEVDGREPHRLTTIAMTIATRTGVDYLWLVHGPQRGGAQPTRELFKQTRTVTTIGSTEPNRMIGPRPGDRPDTPPPPGRPVRQTRPLVGQSVRPHTPVAV